jgi:hypothetical protein
MKKILLLVILSSSFFTVNGQQIALNSQYMFNSFAINPAVAGTKKLFSAYFYF